MTVFEMREKRQTLEIERKSVADWLVENAADPIVTMEDIEAKQNRITDLEARIKIMDAQITAEEAAQRANLAMKRGGGSGMTEEEARMEAKAAFYRGVFSGANLEKSYEGLGGIPAGDADLGNGSALLPKTISNELLTDPMEDNSLRNIEMVSNIPGLEEQKLAFDIEDADLADVTDKQTAKEIAAEGNSVQYGRFKTMVNVTIKNTVLKLSNHDLVPYIENALRSALAIKEKIRAFALPSAYDADHKHMSFYAETDGVSEIKEVTGTDLINAIINAWADLPAAYAGNAKAVMRKQDYYAAIRNLANGNDTLWGKKPEDVLGIPVEFNDRAVIPVVGDFRYARLNYDGAPYIETDKDAKKGEYYFVLNAWFDHRIRIKNAFRLCKVDENPGTAHLSQLKIGSLTLSPTFSQTVHEYTTTTSSATNTINVVAEDSDARILIKLGDTVKQNGDALAWETGANTVTVKVTSGGVSETYTVTVTKS